MPTIKSVLGYAWAVGCALSIPALFFGFSFWPRALVQTTGLQVSPRYSGGKIQRTIAHEGYRTFLREPVFAGVFGDRENGFLQIEWSPDEKRTLPLTIKEDVDADGDGLSDLQIKVETTDGKTELIALKPWIQKVELAIRADNDMIVRIGLTNFRR